MFFLSYAIFVSVDLHRLVQTTESGPSLGSLVVGAQPNWVVGPCRAGTIESCRKQQEACRPDITVPHRPETDSKPWPQP